MATTHTEHETSSTDPGAGSENIAVLAAALAIVLGVLGAAGLADPGFRYIQGRPAADADAGHAGAEGHGAEDDHGAADHAGDRGAATAPPAAHGQRTAPEARTVARGARGAVAAAAPQASEAGVAMLRRGGNAVDALVAASFAVSVVRPHSTGLGGGGFVVYRMADGETLAIDGREEAPAAATRDMYLDPATGEPDPRASLDGPKAAGVPGLVAMLWDLHQRHGALPWPDVVAPAIALAEDGFAISAPLAGAIAARRDVLGRYRASRLVFMPEGRPLAAGEVLRQRDLARTLRAVAERGPEGFYGGWVADAIADVEGGLITREDLRAYEVAARAPTEGAYRGHTVISMPPPSSGGVHLVQMLNVLQGYELGGMGFGSADHLHLLAETMRRAYADRSEHLGDPDFVDVPAEGLTSPSYAASLRRGIDLARATPSREIAPGRPATFGGDHTTHISVVDADGNAVASTQTINTGLGSGVVVPRTGVLLNNEMDDFAAKAGAQNYFGLVQGAKNTVRPGKRPLSSMTPTVVLGPDGDVRLVVGSPGGSRIITSVLQVVLNVVDFGMPVGEAVAAPRVHHQWLPDRLLVDRGFDREVRAELARRGHVLLVGSKTLGNVQAVLVDDEGARVGASDPRGTGEPAAH